MCTTHSYFHWTCKLHPHKREKRHLCLLLHQALDPELPLDPESPFEGCSVDMVLWTWAHLPHFPRKERLIRAPAGWTSPRWPTRQPSRTTPVPQHDSPAPLLQAASVHSFFLPIPCLAASRELTATTILKSLKKRDALCFIYNSSASSTVPFASPSASLIN